MAQSGGNQSAETNRPHSARAQLALDPHNPQMTNIRF